MDGPGRVERVAKAIGWNGQRVWRRGGAVGVGWFEGVVVWCGGGCVFGTVGRDVLCFARVV